ncbi:MAG: GWxTD domain-containing protein, partial [bacterium]|nr:GWxTD domain-containing protein [bacterium]
MKISQIEKVLLLAIFFILLFSRTNYSDDQFQISVDHAQFLGSDNQCYLEIYYSYPENGLQYQRDENNNFGSTVYFTLNIFQDDTLWANKNWKIEKQLPDTTMLSNSKKHLVDLIRYPVDGGRQYSVSLFARDYYSGKMDSAKAELVGKDFVERQLCLSDLILAMNIQPFSGTSDPKFRKRVYDVVPNPALRFGKDLFRKDLHVLFYYFEIYNMTQEMADSQYAVLWQIKDSTGNVVEDNASSLVWRKIAHESSKEIGQFDISGLDNGSYNLWCSVLTPSGKLTSESSSKNFFVNKPVHEIPVATQLITPVEQLLFLEDFDEKQLDQEFDQIYALTTKEARKIYGNLSNLEAKKRFIYNIWKINLSDAGISVGYFRNRFLQLINEVDEKYRTAFKPGWKTDQGIVFLKYGTPSDIERNPNVAGTKPYEVWKYE